MLFFDRRTPRGLILVLDLLICLLSLVLAYLLRFNFATIPPSELHTFPIVFTFVPGMRLISFMIAGTHKGIVRYTGSKDTQRIFICNTTTSLILGFSNIISYFFVSGSYIVPFSIIIIEYLTTLFGMISLRLMYKAIYAELKSPAGSKTNVIIYGAGESGIITKRTLDRDAGMNYRVVAFIDDDRKKWGMKLEGVAILEPNKLEELLKEGGIANVIISIQNIEATRKEEIVETCLKYKTKILNVPPVSSWINGELSFRQIRQIRIEDLLERNVIELHEDNIQNNTRGKTILVTGAAGSIGSEIVRQVSKFNPKKIILIDSAESPLYEMEMELQRFKPFLDYEIILADIRNKDRMDVIINTYRPEVVYHSAAYKHVPMMEKYPHEAIQTNVLGSRIMADLSVRYGVEKFVMISTDKAVNPANVMGASKRIAEIYIQSLNKISHTKFITTRFGNVLGSNGSVIKLFGQQIEKKGPVTVTHPDITRFFMTIPEACQLVLEACAMGQGGEIFVFDMGQPVKISDLASRMIRLAGFVPGKDIQIVYTGLRPGEKLFEELLLPKENTLPTHNPQIMIRRVREYEYAKIAKEIDNLLGLLRDHANVEVVAKMKEIVPEFVSQNSEFEKLDKAVA